MVNITFQLSLSAISEPEILNAIRKSYLSDEFSIYGKTIDSIVHDTLKDVGKKFSRRHYHQVAVAAEHLKSGTQAEIPVEWAKQSKIPTTATRQYIDRTPSNNYLFLTSVIALADTVLCDDQGRISFIWECLSHAGEMLRTVEVSQIAACKLAMRHTAAMVPPRGTEIELAEAKYWARDAVVPPVACGFIAELGRQGLVEVHRHMNISLQSILIWTKLMISDRLPDGLDIEERRLVKTAQRLRSVLLSYLYNNRHSDDLGQQIRMIFSQHKDDLRPSEQIASSSQLGANMPFSIKGTPFERYFLYCLFKQIIQSPTKDLTNAVHAYCLIQNIFLKKLVMPRVDGDGLDRFVELFSGHPIRDEIDGESPERLVLAFRTGRTFWLEARTTPKNPKHRVYSLIRSFQERKEQLGHFNGLDPTAERYRSIANQVASLMPSIEDSLPAVGLVFHFVKKPWKPPAAKNLDATKKKQHNSFLFSTCEIRNGKERYEAWKQVDAIMELQSTDRDIAAKLILAFDVAGSEARTSMGIFASHLRYLRLCGRSVGNPLVPVVSLPEKHYLDRRISLTCHAGEDFDELLGGLRHIDEAIEFYDLEKGDRIGHGTALGIDPERWMERLDRHCLTYQGENLDNLVWFHQWLSAVGEHENVRHQVSDHIGMLSRKVYGERISIDTLWSAWQLRSEDPGDAPDLFNIHTPINSFLLGGRKYATHSLRERVKQIDDPIAFELWKRYHLDPYVLRQCSKTIEINLNPSWIPAISRVQKALTRKLIEKRIVLEINPSSNLTLGPIDDMTEHPVFRWLDPKTDFNAAESPMLIVGSDDPAAFGTELILEYAFLGRAAEEQGATQRQVRTWLQHLRDSGIQFSFFPRESFQRINDSNGSL